MDENKAVTKNYVISFYTNVNSLTSFYANYLNYGLELQEIYGSELNKMDETDRKQLSQLLQNVRYFSHITYVQYCSLIDKLKIKKSEKIDTHYNNIKDKYIIPEKELEQFVIIINSFLMEQVIKDILDLKDGTIQTEYE